MQYIILYHIFAFVKGLFLFFSALGGYFFALFSPGGLPRLFSFLKLSLFPQNKKSGRLAFPSLPLFMPADVLSLVLFRAAAGAGLLLADHLEGIRVQLPADVLGDLLVNLVELAVGPAAAVLLLLAAGEHVLPLHRLDDFPQGDLPAAWILL